MNQKELLKVIAEAAEAGETELDLSNNELSELPLKLANCPTSHRLTSAATN